MLSSRCYHSCQGKEEWLLTAMWYPRVNSSLSNLRSVQIKRKSVASNNNKCDNGSNGAPDHGRRKLDFQAVIGRSKRGYGGSPNRGLLASPAHGGLKCLPADGGHGYGEVNYGADACVRDAGGGGRGGPEKVTAAETSNRYNDNNSNRGGNGAGRKGRKSDGQCSKGLVMEKVIILKRGQTIRDVAAGPSDDADMARVRDGDEMAELRTEGTGCSKVNWFETPDRVRDGWDARSVVGCDVRLGEIDCQDAKKKAEQMWGPREDLGIISTARLGPNPSTISAEMVGTLRPVSIGSSGKSSEVIGDDGEMSTMLPESRGCGGCRGGTAPGSGEAPEKGGGEESSSSPSPVFMLEKWSGPPYCMSPSPRCLPLPKFSMQHKVASNGKDSVDFVGLQMEDGNCSASETLNETLLSLPVFRSCANLIPQAGVDAFATRGLRRLLHLD